MKVTSQSARKSVIVTKSFEVRLNPDVVNAFITRQQHLETRTRATKTGNLGGIHRTVAGKVDSIKAKNRVGRKQNPAVDGNDSMVKSLFQRKINECFNALLKLNEQHAHAKIVLKTKYNAELERLNRDFERKVEEIKKKCISDAGF